MATSGRRTRRSEQILDKENQSPQIQAKPAAAGKVKAKDLARAVSATSLASPAPAPTRSNSFKAPVLPDIHVEEAKKAASGATFKTPEKPIRSSNRTSRRLAPPTKDPAKAAESILSPRTKKRILSTPTKLPTESQLLSEKQVTLQEAETSQIKQGRHSAVSFVTTAAVSPSTRAYALKRSDFFDVQSKAKPSTKASLMRDRSYRELVTYQALTKLRDMPAYYPAPEHCNFIRLRECWIGKASASATIEAEDDDRDTQKCLYLVLEKADMTLLQLFSMAKQVPAPAVAPSPAPIRLVTGEARKAVSLYQVRCLMFQIVFGLHVAQKEYEFVHNDLHLSNILLKAPASAYAQASFKEGETTWYTTGWSVKFSDFGLSRIKYQNVVVSDPELPASQVFCSGDDVDRVRAELVRYTSLDLSIASVVDLQDALSAKEFDLVAKALLAAKAQVKSDVSLPLIEEGQGVDHVYIASLPSQSIIEKVTLHLTEAKKQYGALRTRMGQYCAPTSLLSHDFFDLLQMPPYTPPQSSPASPKKKR